MEIKKDKDILKCLQRLKTCFDNRPESEVFMQHVKAVHLMQLPECTFYQIDRPGMATRKRPCAIISQCKRKHIVEYQIFGQERQVDLVREALVSFVDWKQHNVFYTLLPHQLPVVSEVATQHGAKMVSHRRYNTYFLSNAGMLPEIRTTDNNTLRMLNMDAAPIMDSYWGIRDKGSISSLRRYLEKGIGYGVYDDTKLVSWAVLHMYGDISCVNTVPEARKRGYALLVVHKLARELLGLGLTPHAHVEVGNIASENLFFRKLGFQKSFQHSLVSFMPTY